MAKQSGDDWNLKLGEIRCLLPRENWTSPKGGPGTDLFGPRRSVYISIDRQFLPTLLSVFDFANPDLHSPERSETTTPQQALFAMNHPFVVARAKKIVASLEGSTPVKQLYNKYSDERHPAKKNGSQISFWRMQKSGRCRFRQSSFGRLELWLWRNG